MINTKHDLTTAAFQFYSSPIKTLAIDSAIAFTTKFQFYSSPIKTAMVSSLLENTSGFQFYSSPIKTHSFDFG